MIIYATYRALHHLGAAADRVAPPGGSAMDVPLLADAPAGMGMSVMHETSPLDGLPSFVLVLLALSCLALAAAVAGLTLGLMSLDTVTLDILLHSPDPQQAAAAAAIKPVREQGNLLLVTLLLSNTLAAELLPLVLDALVPGGYFSLAVSVLSLMLFGEMIPQAVCARHPLYFGHKLIFFVRILRFITYPIAAPIAFVLDYLLGEELGTIYDRDGLKGLIDVHAKSKVLTKDETTILKATLGFSLKTASEILTPASKVFMLDIDAVLDRDTMLSILRKGHSRVPVYDATRNNIVCLLLVKQLILINPDNPLPIRALISKRSSNHKVRVGPALECCASTHIADLLNEFQLGSSHLALVYDDIAKPQGQRQFMGIVSIEDIIEEILEEEIVDETDIFMDNTERARVVRSRDGSSSLKFTPVTPTAASRRLALAGDSVRVREIDVKLLRAPLRRERLDDEPMASMDDGPPSQSQSEGALHKMLSAERGESMGMTEETGLLQRSSADGVQSSGALLSRRHSSARGVFASSAGVSSSRLTGPMLNARRSMMSLMCEEDNNVLPEDIAEAHRALAAGGKIQMRPLPETASGERTERILSRLERRKSVKSDEEDVTTAEG